jgi:5-histidylcysteine sulfoxide synthase
MPIYTAPANTLQLDRCNRQEIRAYFDRVWHLEDRLWQSLVSNDVYYFNPDPLRNLLIFYLGHSVAFYINKLIKVELLPQRVDPDFEILFEVGVDPEKPEDIADKFTRLRAADVEAVWQYRSNVYEIIVTLIQQINLKLPITPNHPLWALMMAIEHQYIHLETSSMLLRQLPANTLHRPEGWKYHSANDYTRLNEMVPVAAGIVHLGKPQDSPTYGWDVEYGDRTIPVKEFLVSKYLITNAEFLEFVKAGGYEDSAYWSPIAWQWKTQNGILHPKFWIPDGYTKNTYRYRALFDEIEMPFDYPVEVNHYEAIAYCRWYGKRAGRDTRLMSEAEWRRAINDGDTPTQPVSDYNLNLQLGSPNPVGALETARNQTGIYDLRGNVWEWLSDHPTPLPGYEPHELYEDYSAPYFDTKHYMMVGGSWITCGTEALTDYRNWFRPNFYQHAGFRIVLDENPQGLRRER